MQVYIRFTLPLVCILCLVHNQLHVLGALLFRLLLVVYSMHLGWDIDVLGPGCQPPFSDTGASLGSPSSIPPGQEIANKIAASTRAGLLVGGLCDLLSSRTAHLSEILSIMPSKSESGGGAPQISTSSAPAPMCHGIVLALRYCLEEIDTIGLLREDGTSQTAQQGTRGQWAAMRELWDNRAKRALALAHAGFRLALTVVAEDDNQTGTEQTPSVVDNTAGAAKGPVHVNSYMFVNTNGFMESEGEEERGSSLQRTIVASWLLLKECASLMARLVQMCPSEDSLAPSGRADNQRPPKNKAALLDNSAVHIIGNTLLDSLGRLRHMGAIAEAHSALQTVCETLLRYDIYSHIRQVPAKSMRPSNSHLISVTGKETASCVGCR